MNAPPRDLWRRIEPILERALDLAPESRTPYLEEACEGDERLRQEVESLLEADSDAADFLSGLAGDIAGSFLQELEPAATTELSEGQELGRYRIVRRLGVGGMGVVYEAEDPRLGRRVALKLLPPDLAHDAGRLRRFEREARAVAALSHPNIVTIYSVERSHGVPFFVMELVEGRTLDQLIPDGGMPLETFLDLAVRLADALRIAHEKGLTHRDLKPANVMVTGEGRPKILDFGLVKLEARSLSAAEPDEESMLRTREGAVLGTLPYMSPEQAHGKSVDPRTDIFSLGVILYEMATGDRPFQGETRAALLASILRDDPRPVTDLRPDLPSALEAIILRCLEKEPERRSTPARELRDELGRLRHRIQAERFIVSSGAAAPTGTRRPRNLERKRERTRIVVLPFENLGRPEDEYFAAGLSEEIRSRLASVGDLAVISRTSARAYAGTNRTTAQIGEELAVAYILEGTVRWERHAETTSQMRITPQLIRVADDTHVWAGVYERDLAGIFAVQSDIAERVVEELGVTLLESQRNVIQTRPTENLEAFQAYLRGRAFLAQVDTRVSRLPLAIENFEKAVALDPDFAIAYAELSRIHCEVYADTQDPSEEEEARRHLERALELAPDVPEVQVAQALFDGRVRRDFERALEVLSRIESARPSDTEALQHRGFLLRDKGRWEEALEVIERAAELDPADLWLQERLATYFLLPLERYSEAMEVCDRAIALGPNQKGLYNTKAYTYWAWKGDTERSRTALAALPAVSPISHLLEILQEIFEGNFREALARVSSMSGEWIEAGPLGTWPKSLWEARVYDLLQEPVLAAAAYEAALGLAEEELRRRPDDPMIHSGLGYVYAGLGHKEEAIRAGKRAVELSPTARNAHLGPRYLKHLAAVYTRVGEHEAALDELDRLLSLSSEQLSVPLLRLEPWWEPLRDRPRYRELVRKYGHTE